MLRCRAGQARRRLLAAAMEARIQHEVPAIVLVSSFVLSNKPKAGNSKHSACPRPVPPFKQFPKARTMPIIEVMPRNA